MDSITKTPSSLESEITVINAIFKSPSLIIKACDFLNYTDFYDERNKVIFKAMTELKDSNMMPDISLVAQKLADQNIFDQIGGLYYLKTIARSGYSSLSLDKHLEQVKNASLKRSLISTLSNLVDKGYTNDLSINEYFDVIEQELIKLQKSRTLSGFTKLDVITDDLLVKISDISKRFEMGDDSLTGLKTGYKELDQLTLGLQPTQLVILAARSGMGKSAFALNLATRISKLNINKSTNKPVNVCIFSLEMPREQLVERMLAAEARVFLSNIKKGNLNNFDWMKIQSASNTLKDLNIYFDDQTDITINMIRAKTRKLAVEQGLDLVIIDYLQLIGDDSRSASVQEKVSKISRGLKLMAMELEIPVIALAQLSRAVEQRPDKIPMMSDLRDSGAIEQDADLIMFLYRDEYYNKDLSTRKGEADLIIAKNRNGAIHDGIPLLFNGACSIFEEKK